ncbi:MAG TPA: family 20 glycosylhydrolase [Tepidisphaeraceae bacterium]|nr:family 20 glycosylhydrolase [Tepidisphaeraceae bacterium]
MNHIIAALLIGLAVSSASAAAPTTQPDLPLVPWPGSVRLSDGAMPILPASRIIANDPKLTPLAGVLADEIFLATGKRLAVAEGARASESDIELALDPAMPGDSYHLDVAQHATVRGADYNSVAMGTATLLQAIQIAGPGPAIRHLAIEDHPKFSYRGVLLDVARKPYSIQTLKACVVAARMYKIRFIQLHLGDENAWTFPSTAFPKAGSTNFAWAGGEKPVVYDLHELKDLVAYADARGVTFVPELELPGHSGALRGSLPEIFSFKDANGKPLPAGIINIASEQAYGALDTLVGEAADVFKSSPYVHIGCDETGTEGTEKYPEVLDLVRREKLAGPHALFSYFVSRMAGIVKAHGKQTIVWEGAATDPIAPPRDVIFMPWVGGSGYARTALKNGYRIINAPWGVKHEYFDPYDCNGFDVPHDEQKLLGATAILWESPQELALPYVRYAAALRNEPTFNPDAHRGLEDFLTRQMRVDPLLDRLEHGFTLEADGLLPPTVFNRHDPLFTKSVTLTLAMADQPGRVRYTLDGSEPKESSSAYSGPIVLKASAQVRAQLFDAGGKPLYYAFSRKYRKVTAIAHDAIDATVTFSREPATAGPGPRGLTDGLLAAGDDYSDPGWVGWSGPPMEITLDLHRAKLIRTITPHALNSGGGVELPAKVDVLLSDDGTNFHRAAALTRSDGLKQRGWYVAEINPPREARYVRLVVTQQAEWTYFDEIAVNASLPGPDFIHEAMGKPITVVTPPSPGYTATGVQELTDGYVSNATDFKNVNWLGWEGKNIDATIDMGRPTPLHEVGGRFLQYVWAGIYIPGQVDVLVSDDGKKFRQVATIHTPADKTSRIIKTLSVPLTDVSARYVRLVAHTNGMWLFTDELFVNRRKEAE